MKRWILTSLLLLVVAAPALAHCDTEDGPVILAGREALATSQPELALVWVQPAGEAETRAAFERALVDPAARQAFLETLVRVHRQGEGEPYEGLKPADTPVPAPVEALDRALAARSAEGLDADVRAAWDRLQPLTGYDRQDLEAGRRFVAAYVQEIHHLEEAATPHHGDCCK